MALRTNFFRASTALVAMVAAILLAGPMAHNDPAWAQATTDAVPGTTITVNTTEDEATDDGNCSLREAIEAANSNTVTDNCPAGSDSGQDTILFALGKKATIVLNSELPTITDSAGLAIDGQKAKITVSGNDAVRVFFVFSGAEFNLRNLTVADGKAASGGGGGIANNGALTVTNSTFSGNSADQGGGISNTGGGGTLEVANSTFSGNSADFGGGILNFGTLEVTNSTFSGNSANDQGGGIRHAPPGTATLKNTILANSPSGGNCFGTVPITDGGYNIDDGTTCGFSAANNSLPSTDPLLDPKGLRNNGGPTQTIALLKHSPAINAIPEGTNGCGTEITTDQRGVKRPKGSGCDIGAFEK